MSSVLPVYGLILGITFLAFLFWMMRDDELNSRKLARIRVWTDDRDQRKNQRLQPEEEEYRYPTSLGWLLLLASALFFVLILARAGY